MAALTTLNGSTVSRSASDHFSFAVSGFTPSGDSVTVWKSGITPKMRLSLIWAEPAGETGISGAGASSESLGDWGWPKQTEAAQSARRVATWTLENTHQYGAKA